MEQDLGLVAIGLVFFALLVIGAAGEAWLDGREDRKKRRHEVRLAKILAGKK